MDTGKRIFKGTKKTETLKSSSKILKFSHYSQECALCCRSFVVVIEIRKVAVSKIDKSA